jgi:hypothetical protein
MENTETLLIDLLKRMVKLRDGMEKELDEFNSNMEKTLGGDSRSMYLSPLHVLDNHIIDWLMAFLYESNEGAEWFMYEALDTISHGGSTSVETNGKNYEIRSIEDYVKMCIEVNIKGKKDANSGR